MKTSIHKTLLSASLLLTAAAWIPSAQALCSGEVCSPGPGACTGTPDGSCCGTSAKDTITCVSGRCVIEGFAGDDTLTGSSGDDKICGGGGVDSLSGGAGDDDLFGGTDGDLLSGDAGNDELTGGDGDDLCAGGPGDDTLNTCETTAP